MATTSNEPVEPKRFALKYHPPTLILEYICPKTQKLRHRVVKIKSIESRTDVNRLARKALQNLPPMKTDAERTGKRIVKLMKILKTKNLELQASGVIPVSSIKSHRSGSSRVESPPTRPHLSKATTPLAAPAQTNPPREKHGGQPVHPPGSSSPSDVGSGVSTLRIEDTKTSAPKRRASDTDGLSIDVDVGRSGFEGSARALTPGTEEEGGSRLLDKALSGDSADSRPPESPYFFDGSGEIDLCKVGDDYLKAAKQRMEVEFEKNRVKPGDPSFQYDVQINFPDGEDDNSWDESGDDDNGAPEADPDDFADLLRAYGQSKH